MTLKEVEHYLVENDFVYVTTGSQPFWRHRIGRQCIYDDFVKENPVKAYEFARDLIEARKPRES